MQAMALLQKKYQKGPESAPVIGGLELWVWVFFKGFSQKIHAHRFELFPRLLKQDIWTDEAISDLAERKDRGLIILNSDQRVFAFGGNLSGALACDHYKLETVVYVFQTVFNSDASHGVLLD
jgi:hypothetical protein